MKKLSKKFVLNESAALIEPLVDVHGLHLRAG
jgi:hypothetical protein